MKVTYRDPKGSNKLVTEKLYKSWADTHYSPKGELYFEFTVGDIFENNEIRILGDELKNFSMAIACNLKYNRFTNYTIVAQPFDKIPLDKEQLAQTMWMSAINQFDYDIANIIPFDISKETIKDYKKNRNSNDKGLGSVESQGHTKNITQVLMALEYIQYLSYLPSRNYATWILAEPEMWKTQKGFTAERDNEEVQKKFSSVATRLSRIPKELYTKEQGRQGGILTTQAQLCLYDFLMWTEQKVGKDEINSIFIYNHLPKREKK